jgi:hypothetical protein
LLVLNFEEVKSFVYYTVKKQEVVVESLFILDLRFWIRYEWIVTYVSEIMGSLPIRELPYEDFYLC